MVQAVPKRGSMRERLRSERKVKRKAAYHACSFGKEENMADFEHVHVVREPFTGKPYRFNWHDFRVWITGFLPAARSSRAQSRSSKDPAGSSIINMYDRVL
jgi:hypothetical protein